MKRNPSNQNVNPESDDLQETIGDINLAYASHTTIGS